MSDVTIPLTLSGDLQTVMDTMGRLYAVMYTSGDKKMKACADNLLNQAFDYTVENKIFTREEINENMAIVKNTLNNALKHN